MGMKACAKVQFGSDSLEGKTIAVQGVGHVGEYLVKHLAAEKANVVITDIHEETLKGVANEYGVKVVAPNEIYDVPMDIYAPCAMGATINDETLSRLTCSIIAGAANNQLAIEEKHGLEVMNRGIIYAPDYTINAGGVINCFSELEGLSSEWAHTKAEEIYTTILNIIHRSKEANIPTYQIANKMAEERIAAVGIVKINK
jgi:leucine dehydrogenase